MTGWLDCCMAKHGQTTMQRGIVVWLMQRATAGTFTHDTDWMWDEGWEDWMSVAI